jgi:hypothetical protein
MMISEQYPRPQQDPVVPTPGPVTGAGSAASQAAGPDEGGESACWARLVCPDCGAMESEGHRPGCGSA